MEPVIHQTEEQRWKAFNEYPFSQRALNFFVDSEINSVDRFTKINFQQLRKCRNVGRSVIMEIRLALARMNLSLEGESIYKLPNPVESDDLKARLKVLELRRDEILVEIQHLKSQIMAQRPLKRKPAKNPELDRRLFDRWKTVRDYKIVAQEFGVTINKVRAVVIV